MSDGHEASIRERAYEIWQAEGSPEGRHDQHWQQATADVEQARAEVRQADGDVISSVPTVEDAPAADAQQPAVLPVPTADSPPRKTAVPATIAPKPRRKKGA
ncbi:MAG: DUF2934 domain-containing protein [Janthinobacterium lividum]